MPSSAEPYPFLEPPVGESELGKLAHYRVLSELGRGGMGYVFQAEDAKLKRSVALKVMNQKVAAIPGSRKRFISEARAMAAVHHDNVATIFEVGESKGTPFMAMEMLKGDTLEAFNRSKRGERLDFEVIIDYATQIARGLAAAHARGIVHRDIKPANVWLEPEKNRVKILDFGLALASTPVDQLAGRGAVIGTPGYLSPEQARSDPLDDRSDLYSLGVVLYELCTGKLPIQSKTVPEQLISILADRPTPIGELNPDIPKPLCDLVHRLIRKEPRLRFSSAVDLEHELIEVEEACHKQSEMALAINKLKEGLNQVAAPATDFGGNGALDGPSAFDALGDLPGPVIDPLANLPAPASPIAVTSPSSSGSMKIPASVASRPVSPAKQAKSSEPNVPVWQPYIPLIAVVVLGLLALPIMTFAFTGFGRSTEAYVIDPNEAYDPGPEYSPVDEVAAGQSNQAKSEQNRGNKNSGDKSNKQNRNRDPSANSGNQNNSNATASDSSTDPADLYAAQSQSGENAEPDTMTTAAKPAIVEPDRSSSMDSSADASPDSMREPASANSSDVDSSAGPPSMSSSSPSLSTEGPMLAPESIDSNESESAATDQDIEPTRVLTVTTSDKRGADAMVQNSGSGKQGTKPSLGIRSRGGIELNHTYLRFDLAEWKQAIKQAKDARLTLHVVGGKTPEGARLRLIGIEKVGIWPEAGLDWRNSPSFEKAKRPLESFPVLVDADLSEPGQSSESESGDVARIVGEGKVQIGGPLLAKFLQEHDETVTLALAGSWEDRLLRFVSRERSADEAPKLQVLVPEKSGSRNQ